VVGVVRAAIIDDEDLLHVVVNVPRNAIDGFYEVVYRVVGNDEDPDPGLSHERLSLRQI
jgi:hypothetical protein